MVSGFSRAAPACLSRSRANAFRMPCRTMRLRERDCRVSAVKQGLPSLV
jgi:hypothetical protein